MSHIFLSYARADQGRAEAMAKVLEELGHTVWWDHDIQAGKDFGREIQRAIDGAACVVVLWSEASIASRWVLDESEEGLNKQMLVPVLIEDVQPPMGYRRIEAANLTGWNGSRDDPEFQVLIRAIGHHFSSRAEDGITKFPPPQPTSEPEPIRARSDVVDAPLDIAASLRGMRVRIHHSDSRRNDALSALQVLQASGASPTLARIGAGVHDLHRGAVYYHEDRDVASALVHLFAHVERLTPRRVTDPLEENGLAVCLVDAFELRPQGAKGIRGLKVRLLHAKELSEQAIQAAELLQSAGALPQLDALPRGRVGNRGKVHFHRDAASANVVAEILSNFGAFEVERIEESAAAFEVVAWFLPAALD